MPVLQQLAHDEQTETGLLLLLTPEIPEAPEKQKEPVETSGRLGAFVQESNIFGVGELTPYRSITMSFAYGPYGVEIPAT